MKLTILNLQEILLPFIFSWSAVFLSYFISWWLARIWFPHLLYKKNNKFWFHLMVSSPTVLMALIQYLFLAVIALGAFVVLGFAFPKTSPIEALFSVKRIIDIIFAF